MFPCERHMIFSCMTGHHIDGRGSPPEYIGLWEIPSHRRLWHSQCYAKTTTAGWRFSEEGTHEETLHPQDQEGELRGTRRSRMTRKSTNSRRKLETGKSTNGRQ